MPLIFNFLNYTPQLFSHGAHLHCSNTYKCMKGQGPAAAASSHDKQPSPLGSQLPKCCHLITVKEE
jgi:hypothetical protein